MNTYIDKQIDKQMNTYIDGFTVLLNVQFTYCKSNLSTNPRPLLPIEKSPDYIRLIKN